VTGAKEPKTLAALCFVSNLMVDRGFSLKKAILEDMGGGKRESGLGRLVVVKKLHSGSCATVALGVRYQATNNSRDIQAVYSSNYPEIYQYTKSLIKILYILKNSSNTKPQCLGVEKVDALSKFNSLYAIPC
jgi:hypothetical protein